MFSSGEMSGDHPRSLNLENELPSVLQFEIGSNDIGGTLSVEL